MTLVDFLLARIAEDEADAKFAVEPDSGHGEWQWDEAAGCVWNGTGQAAASNLDGAGGTDGRLFDAGPHIARHDPARVLAECEAKRRIVHRISHGDSPPTVSLLEVDLNSWPTPWFEPESENLAHDVLRLLAHSYRDHPDFDPAWRL